MQAGLFSRPHQDQGIKIQAVQVILNIFWQKLGLIGVEFHMLENWSISYFFESFSMNFLLFFSFFLCLFDDFLIHIQHNSSKLKPRVYFLVSQKGTKMLGFMSITRLLILKESPRPTTVKLQASTDLGQREETFILNLYSSYFDAMNWIFRLQFDD